MGDGLSVVQLYKLVLDHYGNKCSSPWLDSSTSEVHCILYETYPLTCSLDELDRFAANIGLDGRSATGRFFGEATSLNSNVADIEAMLGTIDRWCRLHLPDKFLTVFDAL